MRPIVVFGLTDDVDDDDDDDNDDDNDDDETVVRGGLVDVKSEDPACTVVVATSLDVASTDVPRVVE